MRDGYPSHMPTQRRTSSMATATQLRRTDPPVVCRLSDEPGCVETNAELRKRLQVIPPHITPVGRHHKVSRTSEWWIGTAHATPEEVQHIKGIVLYTHQSFIFLKDSEAQELPHLIEHLLQDLQHVDPPAREEE